MALREKMTFVIRRKGNEIYTKIRISNIIPRHSWQS